MTLAPRLLCISLALVVIGCMMPRSASAEPIVDWLIPDEKADFVARGFSPIPGVQSQRIYDVTQAADGLYNHHPAIAKTGQTLVAAWSNHLEGHATGGEEGPGQKVKYAWKPAEGAWQPAADLFPSLDDHGDAFGAGRAVTANGFAHVDGATYAIAEVADNQAKQSGETRVRNGIGRLARKVNPDGTLGDIFWLDGDPAEPLPGYPQFADPQSDPALAPTATAIKAYLAQPLNQPAWDFVARNDGPLETGDGEDMVEPSTYQRPDGSLVRLWRDGGRRGFLYAQQSTDGGATWTEPQQTHIPDSPSKTVSGMLPDGRVYVVGNQVNGDLYGRDPLTLAISRDGVHFDWAAAIRYDAPKIDFPGKGKGPGFQYPSVTLDGDEMVVVYSIGKEDVAVSRFDIPEFADAATTSQFLVLSSNGNRITQFDGPTGRFVGHAHANTPQTPLDNPVAMTMGPDGLIYVANRNANQVVRIDPISGGYVDVFVDGQGLSAPAGLAFNSAGDLLVGSRNAHNVLRFAGPGSATPGASMGTFVPSGSGGLEGAFNMITGADGDLYVSSFDSSEVLRYDGDTGSFLEVFASGGSLDRPQGLLFDDAGNLLVVSSGNNAVLKYAPDGTSLGTFIDGTGLLNSPNDLTFGPDGMLYVSSRMTQQVLRFDATTGDFIDVFAYGAGMQGATGILFAPVPEPAAASLLVLGGLALLRRRKQGSPRPIG